MARVRYIEENGRQRFAIVPLPLWRRAEVALRSQGRGRPAPVEADRPGADASPGRSVAAWRNRRGLSQAQLARAAGISKAYLSQIETGARRGSLRALQAIALALDISLDQVVG